MSVEERGNDGLWVSRGVGGVCAMLGLSRNTGQGHREGRDLHLLFHFCFVSTLQRALAAFAVETNHQSQLLAGEETTLGASSESANSPLEMLLLHPCLWGSAPFLTFLPALSHPFHLPQAIKVHVVHLWPPEEKCVCTPQTLQYFCRIFCS